MIAKFSRPLPTNVLPRERLFQQADRLKDKPVLWTSGPAGSGKTTLITSYLESRNLPCLWYQTDSRDSDPASFFHYLSLAVQAIDGTGKKPLPMFSSDYMPSLDLFTIRYFEEMFSRFHAPFVFVFDNYQDIPEDSLFHEMMKDGLAGIPSGIHVILISRGDPPASFARMRANSSMGMIGWPDLKMTLEESGDLLHLIDETMLPEEILARLHHFTGGWAAGLILVQDSMRTKEIDLEYSEIIPDDDIFDYFANEIFDWTDPGKKSFLCKTAMFPQMTVHLAEALTGMDASETILSELSRMNHFTEKRLASTISYQYHPLFRRFLRSRAREMFTPDELRQTMSSAALLLEKEGRFDDAFTLFSELNDFPNMSRLIRAHAFLLVSQGRHQTLGNWLETLPEEVVNANVRLVYWTGVVLTPFDPVRGQQYFKNAFDMFRENQDQTGTLLAWSGIVDTHLYSTGTYYSLDPWIDIFQELLDTSPDFPGSRIEARVFSSIVAAMALRRPDHPNYEHWTQRCLSLVRENENAVDRLQVYIPLAFSLVFQGRFHEVALLLKTFGPLAHSEDIPPLPRIMQHLLEAYYFWLTGCFEKAREAAIQGLDLSEKFKIPVFRFMMKGHLAASFLSESRIPEAEAVLVRMEADLESVRPWDNAYYHVMKSWAALIRKDFSKALFHADQSWEMAFKGGEAQSLVCCALVQAIVALEMGDDKQCAALIEKVKNLSFSEFSTFFRFIRLTAEARLAVIQGKAEPAGELLAQAFALGKTHDYCHFYLWQPEGMAGLCLEALKRGIEPDYTRTLIRKRNLMPPEDNGIPEDWPWAIRIHTLGKFEIFLYDDPLQFTGKIQKKPFSLLKVLIALGGRNISEHRIYDILWPDSEGDKAYSAFTSTLSRLRNLLQTKEAIVTHGGLISLNDRLCRVDIWSLESDMDQALDFWRNSSHEEAIALTGKVCAANQGDFLPGEQDLCCAESVRERLKTKFIKCSKALGRYYENASQWEKALHHYAEGLKISPCEETLYKRRMLCFQRMGRSIEAIKEYRQCCAALSKYLDAGPSENIQALYLSLK